MSRTREFKGYWNGLNGPELDLINAFSFSPQFQFSNGIFQSKKKLIENYDDIDLFLSPGCPSLLYLSLVVLNWMAGLMAEDCKLFYHVWNQFSFDERFLCWTESNSMRSRFYVCQLLRLTSATFIIWKNISKYQKEFNLLLRPLFSALAGWHRNLLRVFLLYIFPSIVWGIQLETSLAREYPFSIVFRLQILLHTLWYISHGWKLLKTITLISLSRDGSNKIKS